MLADELDPELQRRNDDYEAKAQGRRAGKNRSFASWHQAVFEQWLRQQGKMGRSKTKHRVAAATARVADGLAQLAKFTGENAVGLIPETADPTSGAGGPRSRFYRPSKLNPGRH